MSTASIVETMLNLAFDADEAAIELAAPSLARHLNIGAEQARARLRCGQLMLPQGEATGLLLSLFKVFGVVMREAAPAALVAVSVQAPMSLAVTIAALLELDLAQIGTGLTQPGGMVFADLSVTEAEVMQAKLRRIKDASVSISAGLGTCFDVFPLSSIAPRDARRLSAYLELAGFLPCRCSGAMAAQLTRAQAEQILTRFPHCGLIALDRAFQRFDLYLTGIGDLPASDVAAFLETRVNLGGVMVECVTPLTPLRIESALTWTAARAFCADYAAIGLQTGMRLTVGNS